MITKEIIYKELPEVWKDNKFLFFYMIPALFLVIPCALIWDVYNKFARGDKNDAN